MPHRKRLPDVRRSHTTKVEFSDSQDIYITTGFFDEDYAESIVPAEVFCKVGKHGDIISGLFEGLCIALSMAFQQGVPWPEIGDKFRGMRFGAASQHYKSVLHAFSEAMDKNIAARIAELGPPCDSGPEPQKCQLLMGAGSCDCDECHPA